VNVQVRRLVDWVKRQERVPVYLAGSVRLNDGKKLAVIITDLSSDGCKVQSRQMLPIGEIVELAVPGRVSLHASIRWSLAGETGLQYI
jgi:hypothetical protein